MRVGEKGFHYKNFTVQTFFRTPIRGDPDGSGLIRVGYGWIRVDPDGSGRIRGKVIGCLPTSLRGVLGDSPTIGRWFSIVAFVSVGHVAESVSVSKVNE